MLKAVHERLARLMHLLRCVDCGGVLQAGDRDPRCTRCGRLFGFAGDILQMMPASPAPRPALYRDPDYSAFKRLFELEDADVAHYANLNLTFRLIHHAAHRMTHRYFRRRRGAGWVADLACGTGDHLGYFGNQDRLVGVDASLGSLEAARRHYPGVPLIQADLLHLPFKDRTLSCLFAVHVLEHIYFLDGALGEMQRILTDAGSLYVGLPAEGGWAYSLGRRFTVQRIFERRFGFNYARAIAIAHCNTAAAVIQACRRTFSLRRVCFSPIPFVPAIGPNVAVALECAR